MSKTDITRDNHYVPIWHQKGFRARGKKKLHYLNMTPDEIHLPDGRIKHHRALFESYPTQCFYQTDLYSTFFDVHMGDESIHVNDEIERKLFGDIDTSGSNAVKAFLGSDLSEWHKHFQNLFIYLDAQKFRTPKGLEWIKTRYPTLDQNALMREMQGVRTINCTLWTEGVREIVSAREAGVKFLLTDHPVTIYNYVCPPNHEFCGYPNDPSIALKASQTLFPLDQDQCLILTNLEYAKEPNTIDPLEKRTHARQVRQSLVRTDKFIKTRTLRDADVIAINHVLKSRAKRFIAAGNKDWLWPEKSFQGTWKDIQATLLPPKDELWSFGGETFVGYKDGSVDYQDAYGRKTKAAEFLNKDIKEAELGVNDLCGCGSGKKYKKCCKEKPKSKRTSWKTLSIRERNLGFFRGVNAILGLDSGKDWNDVRRELDEEKVRRIHELYGYTWPLDTDLFDLLPKPDGVARALYAGILDPRTTPFIVSNACMYLGEVLVQNPFINPNQVNKEFSPVENPHSFLVQTLKNLLFFFQLFPLIESGHVNLFPDPSSVDPFLQRHAMELAEERSSGLHVSGRDRGMLERLQEENFQHTLCMLPKEEQERMARRADLNAPEEFVQYYLKQLERLREENPLVLLRDGVFSGDDGGGQFTSFQMAPNFELMLMIAQATGAFVVTDSHYRWRELGAACHRDAGIVNLRAPRVAEHVSAKALPLCEDLMSADFMLAEGKLQGHRKWIETLNEKLSVAGIPVPEDTLIEAHDRAVRNVKTQFGDYASGDTAICFQFMAPEGGMYHNNVRRLMVRSGIDDRPDRIPLAVLMDIAAS
ncbi:DUF4238 domain-containing protein [Leisingera sp. M527]|uniref:DUF4238 domain-containing protein n=1 Tax=Leisingera sp. M527 TaxID=2867014 RepID=UPI0021A93D7F|nr:DUF4238 domain-containing protein [Leisingera sp. M527]UWQ31635.1 DUF4238 domain-containing protein [Leisingera sp. M527]